MAQCQIESPAINHLDEFELDAQRGLLPLPDPLERLPLDFEPWEDIAQDLPKLLVSRQIRPVLERLPVLLPTTLREDRQHRRAMLLLSFLGHAYVWGGPEPANRIPAGIAVPWYHVSQQLGRPPVLSYASYALDNWRRLDPSGPIVLGNIVLLQNFLGGLDEEWFILVHVDIEAKAAPALAATIQAQEAVNQDQPPALAQQLAAIASATHKMWQTLLRMPESCDPYIYYHRVRPYIHGWKNHPALPDGVLYEGVDAYEAQPQKFRGETGAQSSIIPCLDAALGIVHEEDALHRYLTEMREYMPPKHRRLIEAIEQGPSIRHYVLEHPRSGAAVRNAYNACIHWLERFRSTHLEYAKTYIQKQSECGANNPIDIGTGGTPFIPYLKKHRDETTQHKTE
jgi:indoleamine 2,3-dioxygenase